MNEEQFHQIASGRGFIAALDQSGGSTPGALARYGISHESYADDDEMFDLMHAMRSRIITNPSFSGDRILATILFEDTIDREIEGVSSVDYVWARKHVVPFLKVDKGLAKEVDGARCMNPMPELDTLLAKARRRGVFGTKMRSFVRRANPAGVAAVLDQQFAVARQIVATGLVPILEPEVDVTSPEKESAEELLLDGLARRLEKLAATEKVILKLTLPEHDDLYAPLIGHPNVLRVAALSGGYSHEEAITRLARNHGMIASFSRGLTEGLTVTMSDDTFGAALERSIAEIYAASIT